MPPRTIRITASQSRPTGVVSSILSAGMRVLHLEAWVRCAAKGRCDRGRSNHCVATHEACSLAWSHAEHRFSQLELERAVAAGRRRPDDAAADGARAVAELHA